tara:strand:- start:389320 stop:389505 length:186 start_codon:yes stop_codon:yes gene_type:complete
MIVDPVWLRRSKTSLAAAVEKACAPDIFRRNIDRSRHRPIGPLTVRAVDSPARTVDSGLFD